MDRNKCLDDAKESNRRCVGGSHYESKQKACHAGFKSQLKYCDLRYQMSNKLKKQFTCLILAIFVLVITKN